MIRVRSVIAVALTATVTAFLAIGPATSAEGQAPFRFDLSNFMLETVQVSASFPLYFSGTQFEDIPLTAIVRVNQKSMRKAREGFGVPDNERTT